MTVSIEDEFAARDALRVSDEREIIVGNLLTGQLYATLPAHDADWSMVHRKEGKISASVLVTPTLLEQYPDLTMQIREWRSYIGVRMVETQQVLQAGPVTSWSFDSSSEVLSITGAGLARYFSKRYLVKATGKYADIPAQLSFTKQTLGTIARNVVAQTLGHPGASLPVVLPDAVTGSNERHYFGYEMGGVWERLTQIMEVLSGPDIMFQPRMKDATHLEWVMRVGDPLLTQEGDDWFFTIGNPQSAILSYEVTSDGADMAYRAFAVGSGQNEDALIAQQADWTMIDQYGFPLLERKETYSSVTDSSTLQSWAAANVGANKAPWKTWTFEVDPNAHPRLGDYRPGDWVTLRIDKKYPFLPDGTFRGRIMTVSGKIDGKVKIELTPVVDDRQ